MMRKLLFLLICCSITFHYANAVTYIVAQSGNWSDISTWAIGKTGTITTATNSPIVTGLTTKFTTEQFAGSKLYTSSGQLLGTVASISDDLHLTLTANAASNNAGISYYSSLFVEKSGTINTTSGSISVTGSGTNFTSELGVGYNLYSPTGQLLGAVASITNNTTLTLIANAPATNTAISYFSIPPSSRTGTLTTSATSTAVTGTGTNFTSELCNGNILFTPSMAILGTVSSITSATQLTLSGNATQTNREINFYSPSPTAPAMIQTGTIATTAGNTTVDGTGTNFNTLKPGCQIYNSSMTLLGTVASIGSGTQLTLTAGGAASTYSGTFYATLTASRAGNISVTIGTTVVTGSGTNFTSTEFVGGNLYTNAGVFIGTITSITDGTHLTLAANASSTYASVAYYSTTAIQRTGTIATSTSSTTITGTGTSFTTELNIGSKIYSSTNPGQLIGTVASIISNTTLTLTANAPQNNARTSYKATACGNSTIPTTSDDVIIPTGKTVTNGTALQNYKSLSVSGTLNISSGNLEVINQNSVVINSGGSINVSSGNLNFKTNSSPPGPSLTIATGGTLNVSGSISSGDNSSSRSFVNSGYIEIGGSITVDPITVTNSATGVILIHGNIGNAGSNTTFDNFGIITVDNSISFTKTFFTNEASGKFFVFGDISIDNSSKYFNYGLTQCNNFNIGDAPFYNSDCSGTNLTGTISTIKNNVTVNGKGTKFTQELSVGSTVTDINCIGIGIIDSIYNDSLLTFSANATAPNHNGAYSANTNINYRVSIPGTIITLGSYNSTSNTCPGCARQTWGNLYYNTYTFPMAPWCSGDHCLDWFKTQSHVVSVGRKLWLSSSFIGYGLSNDGDKINQWFDLANSYGFDMKSTGGSQPVLTDNSSTNLNFNPVMSFNGSQFMSLSQAKDSMNAWSSRGGLAMFGVVIPASGNANQPFLDYGLYPTNGLGMSASSSTLSGYTATAPGGKENTTAGTTTPSLLSMTTAWSGNQTLFVNGAASLPAKTVSLTKLNVGTEIAFSSPYSAGVSGPVTIGASSANPTVTTTSYYGKMAEVIVYASAVNTTVQNQTEAYLAIKYGLTVSHDLLNSSGTKIWDYTTFNNDVAGLMRDDLNFLHQRQSKSINAGVELTVSTGAFVSGNQKNVGTDINKNLSSLIWGNNGATVASGNRIYKITATNFNQTVNLQFNIASGVSANTILIIADDPAFITNARAITPSNYSAPYLKYSYKFKNSNLTPTTTYFKILSTSGTPSVPGVGINTTVIDSSAELHIVSTDKGILLPMLTDQTSITSAPPAGLIFYNTTHKRFMYNAGTSTAPVWKFVGEPLKQTSVELQNNDGYYVGEIRYNTDAGKKNLWIWDGTKWKELKNN